MSSNSIHPLADTRHKDIIDSLRMPSNTRVANRDIVTGTISASHPFEIHEEKHENQMTTELSSFVDYEHDNKENIMHYADVDVPSALREMTVMSGSHSTVHDPMSSQLSLVSRALYNSHHGPSHAYGLDDVTSG